ncbi:MAG: type II toxin-antitoxin system VapC family toxin [Xenococcaceae cyanobacterium MO_167.B52]|nr:type II toxin-antitoxin system VapC family toxin [Xenococcaceae cyanobacterium MO_167.B52]
MMYLLDTNTVSDYLKGNPGVLKNLKRHHHSLVAISSITKYELFYGLLKNPQAHQKYGEQLRLLFKQAQNMVFDEESALLAAQIKQELIQQGKSIGDCDTMIAAIGLQHNAVVVTNNVKHFQRVKNLVVVNWRE